MPSGDDETRLRSDSDATRAHEDAAQPGAAAVARTPSSSSGWLSSSGSIDHGRFTPGTLLGGRYRIVGRLGRGGMGEVYRADDLKLGQPVALKFLPPEVDHDPARLTQLHTEVRMARQVSHPNVCRVYDIDEVDGQTFLSMEYVDGEDLSSLLRRIGRFPQERALEVARQICAGLAAAHDRGVVHRDFKPANVMLDGTGRVRITDFGLAGAAGEALRAGTPAYMAPEQLAGGEVTVRSDIYALGLVLYEVFTGQRALEGRNLAELIHRREQGEIALPTSLVRDLDPQIERAIMRCLALDAAARPASALSAAAALPGGDPLAAALAAGETPSPQMVAAAGATDALPRAWAIASALFMIAGLAVVTLCYQRVLLINRVPAPKSPAVLQDRAQEALASLGYADTPVDAAWGLGVSLDYAAFVRSTMNTPDRWRHLAFARPESILLWYRTSPRPLNPLGLENAVSGTNPPLSVGGMTLLVVDGAGRLAEFHAVPQPQAADGPHAPTDWRVLFAAAALPVDAFKPIAPQWLPVVFADERMSWEGRLPENPEQTFRVEAAAYAGKPVYFVVTGPWSRSQRAAAAAVPRFTATINALSALIMPALMVLGAVLARRNIRLGRGDRQGAFRAASALFAVGLGAWLLGNSHTGQVSVEIDRVFAAIGRSLFDAAVLWLAYLGLEPYVRRTWPDSLIGWTRLISGRWIDGRVARDVLIGVCVGIVMTVFFAVHNLLPLIVGRPEPMPLPMDLSPLMGFRYTMSVVLDRIGEAILSSVLGVAGVVGLLILLRRQWAAGVAAMIVFLPVVLSGMFPAGTPWLDLLAGAGIIGLFVGVIMRFGLLATMAALSTHMILLRAPITTDINNWRAAPGLWMLAVVATVGFAACYVASRLRTPADEVLWHGKL